MRSRVFLLVFWLWSSFLAGQDRPLLPIFIAPDLDTNYIDLQRDKWSLRAFSSLKFHILSIEDRVQGRNVRYLPNNLVAVGVGFAYRFWLIDLGFGLNPVRNNATEAFDLQTSVILGSRHLFSYGLQWYRGFQAAEDGQRNFRKDIQVFYSGLDYYYYFNYRRLSMRAIFRGDLRQLKSSFSFIAGAFIAADYVRSDSSLISLEGLPPDLSKVNSNIWMTGIQGGMAGSWVVARNLIFFGSVVPGIGGEWGNIEGRGTEFRPKWGPVGKVSAHAAIMYTHPRFYLGFSGMGNFYFPVINKDFRYRYQVGKLKLLFGWRFFSRVGFLEKANRLLEKR